jgi:hypothetical protein
MGAYRQGILELCDFVHPTIGIDRRRTAASGTFKSTKRQATKYELIEALPPGVASSTTTIRVAARWRVTTHARLRYGLEPRADLDLWAENIAMGPEGCRSPWQARATGASIARSSSDATAS